MVKSTINHLSEKKAKLVKQSEIIINGKLLKTQKNCWYKISVTEHPKTSHKLSKTIRQAEKVGSNSFLYSDAKNREFFEQKM